MKKLTLFLSVLLAMAVFAFAAGAAPVEYTANEKGSFDVTYTGTRGEYYALVIVEGIAAEGTDPVITNDNIQYINQVTAGANGVAAFDGILLKDPGTAGTVYLGGSDRGNKGALLLGYVNKANARFTVSGTITSESAKEANISLTSTTDEAKVFPVVTSAGAYTVTVPADTYKFVVTKAAHLSYTKNALNVSANVVKDVKLLGGDVVQSGTIDYADLGKVVSAYGTASENYDITGEGTVDYRDLSIVITNYNATAVVEE